MNRKQRRAAKRAEQLKQQAAEPRTEDPTIPSAIIFRAGIAIDRIGQKHAQKYVGAPNVSKVARQKRTGFIMEIHVVPHGDDSRMRSTGSGQSLTYKERPVDTLITILKVYDKKQQVFRKWCEDDSFNPRRFNPDLVATNNREFAQQQLR